MNNSKKSSNFVRQNEKPTLKSQKHDANLQKNSTLYFQIGLILCLLASYAGFEMTFATSVDKYVYKALPDDEIYEIVPENFKIEKEKAPEIKKELPKEEPKKSNDFEVVDDDTKIKQAEKEIITIPELTKPTKTVVDDSVFNDIEDPTETNESFNILAVQKVPVYPGCESATNNEERRTCMSKKLSKLIQKKFDSDLASELGLKGKQNIHVLFKINKKGEVEIQKIRAPHKKLETEAKRVVNKIPKMQPGKNNDTPVNVSYTLPIVFKVY